MRSSGNLELVRLVQRDLEHARDHLHAAGKALGRGVDERQLLRVEARSRRAMPRDQCGWRWTAAFQHQRRGRGTVPVAELLEQRFAARERARRPGAEREEGILAFAVGQGASRHIGWRGKR